MPRTNGDEVVAQMRGLREDVPVVLSSGYSEAESLWKFVDRGASEFLQKPYGKAELAAAVRAALA